MTKKLEVCSCFFFLLGPHPRRTRTRLYTEHNVFFFQPKTKGGTLRRATHAVARRTCPQFSFTCPPRGFILLVMWEVAPKNCFAQVCSRPESRVQWMACVVIRLRRRRSCLTAPIGREVALPGWHVRNRWKGVGHFRANASPVWARA